MTDYTPGIYQIIRPPVAGPLVFDSPHSGNVYPSDFGFSCDPALLARAEDTRVDDLFSAAPEFGGTFIRALFPRTYIDVNRAEDDIDLELLNERWPHPVSADGRSAAGHGLIRRLLRPGYPIYDRPLSVAEKQARIETYYRPYHAALASLLDETYDEHGQVWLVDCHSMPSSSAYAGTGGIFTFHGGTQVDIVLGNRDGTTCSAHFTRDLRDFLTRLGYRVALNNPYKGMEILRRHGDPLRNRHAIQIELSKALYLNEDTNQPTSGYAKLKDNLTAMIGFMRDYIEQARLPQAAD